jgi:hypothetical protein
VLSSAQLSSAQLSSAQLSSAQLSSARARPRIHDDNNNNINNNGATATATAAAAAAATATALYCLSRPPGRPPAEAIADFLAVLQKVIEVLRIVRLQLHSCACLWLVFLLFSYFVMIGIV